MGLPGRAQHTADELDGQDESEGGEVLQKHVSALGANGAVDGVDGVRHRPVLKFF